MKTKIKQIFGRTDEVLSNYAFVLLASLLAAICAIIINQNSRSYGENYELIEQKNYILTKFGLISGLGISLLFTLNILSERIGKKIILNIFGVLFLVGFYFIFPKILKNFTIVHGIILAISALLSHLLVAFMAFVKKENTETSFWQYNKNLFINIILTAIFTGVLVGGVELAILAVDKLFDFNFDQKNYFNTFVFLAIFGSTFIFLLFNEKGLKYLENDGEYPIILKFFTQFVLIPLLIIYAIILYFYGGKILINWTLPRGWVSYLILAYSLVGILALLLVHPLKENISKSWVKIFSKIFYFTLVPLIVLLFVSIFTRILAYGFTEKRYYVLLIAIWLTTTVFYFIFWRKSSIKFIPISLFVFGLFSLIFPYFNAFSVANHSQKTELQNILTQNKLLENGKINFDKPVQDSVVSEIGEKFDFLSERKEKKFLTHFISQKDSKNFKSIFEDKATTFYISGDIRNAFNHQIYSKNKETEHSNYLNISTNQKVLPVAGYDYIIQYNSGGNDAISFDNSKLQIIQGDSDLNSTTFKVELTDAANSPKSYDLTPFLKKIAEENKNKAATVHLDEISTEFDLYHL